MAGNIEGGKLAAKKNKEIYGEDFYRIIGAKGGEAKYTGKKGFAAMTPEQRSEAGRKGGSVSKRDYSTNNQQISADSKKQVWRVKVFKGINITK